MTLNDEQIDRYSRQIIVSGFGGAGQERLLAAHLLLVGDPPELLPAFDYCVGAGIGTGIGTEIGMIDLAVDDEPTAAALITRAHARNPAVRLRLATAIAPTTQAILVIAANDRIIERWQRLTAGPWDAALVFARLASPGQIAVISQRPPCPACAGNNLLAPAAAAGENSRLTTDVRPVTNARLITMIAVLETMRLLLQPPPTGPAATTKDNSHAPFTLEFSGYATTVRELPPRVTAAACGCPARRDDVVA